MRNVFAIPANNAYVERISALWTIYGDPKEADLDLTCLRQSFA